MDNFKDPASPAKEKRANNHQDHDSHCGTDVARARWALLRQVLKEKQLDSSDVQQVSVRRFSSFNLFSRSRVTTTETGDPSDGPWVEYRSTIFPQYSALLRDNLGPLRVDEVLNSFDNTGNVYVRSVIERNRLDGLLLSSNVSTRVVRWDNEDDVSSLEGRFDVVMCADCLFLDQYRGSLVDALRRLLRPDGTALVFAPTRGDTLAEFCRLAESAGLCVCRYDNYDSNVWDLHLKMQRESKEVYDENIHYPLLLTLTHGSTPALI
ncbi:putative calmodulin-lysine N-methyltransferase [Triplophysa rosa]|uniref:Calmodulin-lysine N-methyltransferase n=1 Tax=Triplophysa rosa TaxID=992332 RepID=A0A9W8C298_TRIRA|nr:putative calmodulin-lysine N-methyltransferase [Triplophysa rosa]